MRLKKGRWACVDNRRLKISRAFLKREAMLFMKSIDPCRAATKNGVLPSVFFVKKYFSQMSVIM